MQLGLNLCLKLEMPLRAFSPILGLSPLELELLLDQSLEQVSNFHEQNPNWRNDNPPEERGNYFQHEKFLNASRLVAGKIPKARYLEMPQVIVEKREEGYLTRYNLQINERIAEKLAMFKRSDYSETLPADKIFSRQFEKERAWIVKQQEAIVKYLCETQCQYLQTGNPLDLSPIVQQNVARHIGYSITSVCRLVRNLSIQLPDNRIIFADELIPGANTTIQKGVYALKQLQQDSAFYEKGRWKVSDQKLVPILKEKFGIEAARRTVSKYKGMLG